MQVRVGGEDSSSLCAPSGSRKRRREGEKKREVLERGPRQVVRLRRNPFFVFLSGESTTPAQMRDSEREWCDEDSVDEDQRRKRRKNAAKPAKRRSEMADDALVCGEMWRMGEEGETVELRQNDGGTKGGTVCRKSASAVFLFFLVCPLFPCHIHFS